MSRYTTLQRPVLGRIDGSNDINLDENHLM